MAQPTKEKQRETRPGKVVPEILLPGVWYRMYFAPPMNKLYRVMVSLEERKEIPEFSFVFELKVPVDFEFYKCHIVDSESGSSLSICSNGTFVLAQNGEDLEIPSPVCTNGFVKETATQPIAARTPANWLSFINDIPYLKVYFKKLDASNLPHRWDLKTPQEASHPGSILKHARREILHVAGFPGEFEMPPPTDPNLNPLSGKKLTVTWKEDLPYRFRKP